MEIFQQLDRQLQITTKPSERIPLLINLAWKLQSIDIDRSRELIEESKRLSDQDGNRLGQAVYLIWTGTNQLEYGTTDAALEMLDEAIKQLEPLNDTLWMARALDSLGWAWYIRGKYDQARTLHNRSLTMREKMGDPIEIGDSLNSLSAILCDLGDYAEAVRLLLRALALAEERNSAYDQIRFLTNIGTIYMEIGENAQAVEKLKHVLELADQINYHKVKAFAYASLGLAYREMGNLTESLRWSLASLELPVETVPNYQRADALSNTGDVYRRLGDLEAAKPYLEEAITLSRQISDPTTESKGLMAWGEWQIAAKHPDTALPILEEALEKAEQAHYSQLVYQVHEAMSNCYNSLGEHQKALHHYNMFHQKKEEVFNRDSIARRRLLEIQFDLDRAKEGRRVADALRQASLALNEHLKQEQVLNVMLEQAHHIAPFETARILSVTGRTFQVVREVNERKSFPFKETPRNIRLKIDEFPQLQQLVETGQTTAISDTASVSAWSAQPPFEQARSWVGAPISGYRKEKFILSLSSSRANTFNARHAENLSVYASHAALALENSRLFEETQRLAITDGLTGLFNRRHLFELAEKEIARSRRYQFPLSVIMVDIDRFKEVNDHYGHLVGDQVLRDVASQCKRTLREVDIIGRYGGEEFLILLPETSLEGATQTGQRLCDAVAGLQHKAGDHIFAITASMGVSTLQPGMYRLEHLLDTVDNALYRAKQEGRNRISS